MYFNYEFLIKKKFMIKYHRLTIQLFIWFMIKNLHKINQSSLIKKTKFNLFIHVDFQCRAYFQGFCEKLFSFLFQRLVPSKALMLLLGSGLFF